MNMIPRETTSSWNLKLLVIYMAVEKCDMGTKLPLSVEA